MYLSNLEIIGFKSFANKTNFKFTDGITSIVGPNGCGKTNVVDAIRWVLGEQKTSVLRSEVMENVIFNGTSVRKPLGLAEVSLTLQNNKEVLPTEYTEVTLSRRLFRNGESQYLLNNTQCRLRDIVDLFMDTGMGADSYSVIELKMVESILNGKTEERRHLLEEAAGVTKYKFRRKEAGRKLQNVQTDLVRIRDIVSEVQKNVNSLYRQASKTRRYNNLLEELRNVELELIIQDVLNYKEELIILNADFEKQKTEKDSLKLEYEEKESYALKLNHSLREIENSFETVQEQENSIKKLIYDKTREKAVTEERINSLIISNERKQNDISDSNDAIKELEQNKILNHENLTVLKEQTSIFEKELSELNLERDKTNQVVLESRNHFDSSNEELRKLQSRKDSKTFTLNQNEQRKRNLTNNSSEYLEDINKLNSGLRQIEEDYVKAESQREMLNESFVAAENLLKVEQEKFTDFQQNQESLRNEINELQNNLNLKNASLEFIITLVDSNESTKYLLDTKEWEIGNEKILLAEAIGVDEQYVIAIDAALGEAGRYFIVDSKQDAMNAITVLKDNNKGRATFICKNLIKDIQAPNTPINKNGIIGWVSEIVRVEDNLRFALRGILGKTLLVENAEIITELQQKNIADIYVTLSGEIFSSKGIISGGSQPQTETLTIGKKEKINVYNSDIRLLEEKLSVVKSNFDIIKNELDTINISELNENIRKAESEKNYNEQILSQLKIRKESFLDNISVIQKNIDKANEELKNLESEEKNLLDELNKIEDEIILSKENLEKQQVNLSQAQESLNTADSDLKASEMKFVRLEEEIKNTGKEISRIEQQISIFENRITKDIEEISQNELHISQFKNNLEQIENDVNHLQISADEVQNEKEQLHEQINSLQEQIQLYTDDISRQRKDFERSNEILHQKELKIGEVQSKIDNLFQRAKDNHNVDLDTSEQIKIEDFSFDESRTKVGVLKDKLNSLGQVNFMALEEYDEQNERLSFLTKQVKDLEESETNLSETITEINRTAEQKFLETFILINGHFKELFQTLFGKEGNAELVLSEGDPLEANIEIIAKPPGKKPHSIEMLSGGEKTLTAIALLFSIYLVKPSPFCILDEVDAPLDDSNIDRFINLIRQFSTNTQFLIVTHNKKTMEASDSLYGITMPEEGISKVVSVKLSPELV